jgi:LysR family transcriptional regulator, cyn operon transcriptional activator
MELRQLRYFIHSAELQNFTEASKVLFITQSTLSQQIKQLEEELNILLFERKGKRVTLTEAGEAFLPFARKTIRDTELGVQKLMDLQNIRTGVLKIGVTYTLSHLLTDTLVEYSRAFPYIKLEITCKTSTDLTILLKENLVDFVLSYKPITEDNQIVITPLFDSALSVVVSDQHPLAALKKVSLGLLKTYPLVLPSQGMHARTVLDNLLTTHRTTLPCQVELNEVNILLNLVRKGHWATVLSNATIIGQEGLKAIPLTEKSLEMQASLLWLNGSYKKHSAEAFIKMLIKKVEK